MAEEKKTEDLMEQNPIEQQAQPIPDDETQVQIDDDPEPAQPGEYMTAWGERANRLSDGTWTAIQIVIGVLLGAAVSACLYLVRSEGFVALNVIVAFLIAKFGPSCLEMLFERKMPKAVIVMLITLAAILAAYAIYLFMLHGEPLGIG